MRTYTDSYGTYYHYDIDVEHGKVETTSTECTVYKDNCKIVSIDLDSKYAEVLLWNDGKVPVIELDVTDKTLYTSKLINTTTITLPEFEGWGVFDAYINQYSLYVILYPR